MVSEGDRERPVSRNRQKVVSREAERARFEAAFALLEDLDRVALERRTVNDRAAIGGEACAPDRPASERDLLELRNRPLGGLSTPDEPGGQKDKCPRQSGE